MISATLFHYLDDATGSCLVLDRLKGPDHHKFWGLVSHTKFWIREALFFRKI